MCDGAIGIPPNLGAGSAVVHQIIIGVGKLVKHIIASLC